MAKYRCISKECYPDINAPVKYYLDESAALNSTSGEILLCTWCNTQYVLVDDTENKCHIQIKGGPTPKFHDR